ncbi:MAG TPA: KTSC domain-containing protein [Chitinophagaceae bacterium]
MPSAVIKSFEYDGTTGTLIITYVSGLVYAYDQVPEAEYAAFRTAFSKGHYLNAHIKGKYHYRKIENRQAGM